jgi:hypothetical protein
LYGDRRRTPVRLMTGSNPRAERRLSKFSNADPTAYRQPPAGQPVQPPPAAAPINPLLSGVLDLIRDSGIDGRPQQPEPLTAGGGSAEEAPFQTLPRKLIDELSAHQRQLAAAKAVAVAPDIAIEPAAPGAARVSLAANRALAMARKHANGQTAKKLLEAAVGLASASLGSGRVLAGSVFHAIRPRNLQRNYLSLVTLLHRRVFDRRTEQLLFHKTPPLKPFGGETERQGEARRFVYQGPLPGKVMNWAMSALPPDLKRYAFVDFRAGHGRSLLLATRYNFEYAVGYTFDAQSRQDLEMNVAQFPRSYMTCRDVRVIRGDREGILIPLLPAVLFFPDGVREQHLEIILNHVSTSYRLNPRPIYLIFENSGPEHGLGQMEMFEKVPLPFLNRIKCILFNPAKVAVYRSARSQSVF